MKDKLTCIVFAILLLLVPTLHLALEDEPVSYAERRTLASPPKLTAGDVLSSEYSEDVETYLLDQFPFRQQLRTLKAGVHYGLMRVKENNGIYILDGAAYKPDYPLNSAAARNFNKMLGSIKAAFFEGTRCYVAIIPDKSCYAQGDMLMLDYPALAAEAVRGADMEYIDLYDCLDLSSYYRTDPHWRQERLSPVVSRLCEAMRLPLPDEALLRHSYEPFYGAYYGQSALPLNADELVYLSGQSTDAAYVENMESPDFHYTYDTAKLGRMDSYDVFLSGATPLITVKNALNPDGKRLIIFRDSYASSLAPLLLPSVSEITLVDLRYISASLLPEYLDVQAAAQQNTEVLFLFSSSVVNNSYMLKF